MRFFLLKKNRKPYTYYVDGDAARRRFAARRE